MSLIERWNTLPRAGKWLAVFVVFLIGYFAVTPLLDKAAELNAKADQAESRLRSAVATADQLKQSRAEIERNIVALGKLKPYASGSDPQAALDRRLSEIVRQYTLNERRRAAKAPGPLPTVTPAPRTITGEAPPKLDRVSMEWQIDCDTTTLMNVLRELEIAPEVHSVASVQARKLSDNARTSEGEGTLSITFTVESWFPSKGQPGAPAQPAAAATDIGSSSSSSTGGAR
ncbi:MAG: hypothetical protein IBJ18_08990 [Phycisphaerales bacterium]|nr:hypothetical protein [Phycisphaerales bacterium]